ncbi:MAG: hypothetical protein OMM_15161 [Candidatus Magnetoglobus multicellularis str. Araruama]|uniref:Uncharacterized protein n=1 Tax=Candidatus Magnetoglobus multicellularis str. Araruama TaxID=890399 RepID=A0A1V1NQX1_9BACT|nr:MAG: hypothetical protein OMM_15161 [Candidatus Magnetoglobus multicellularis str. Araruama]
MVSSIIFVSLEFLVLTHFFNSDALNCDFWEKNIPVANQVFGYEIVETRHDLFYVFVSGIWIIFGKFFSENYLDERRLLSGERFVFGCCTTGNHLGIEATAVRQKSSICRMITLLT